MESWSGAPTRGDRTRSKHTSGFFSWIASGSWSSAQRRDDRTRVAVVDIHVTEQASWSSAPRRDDRTRNADGIDQNRRSAIAVRGTAAIGALSIAFLLTPQLARATSDPAAAPSTVPATETASAPATTTTAAPATTTSAPATTTTAAPATTTAQPEPSAPAAPPATGEQAATEADLEVLLDAIVEAADGQAAEDGGSTEDAAADDPEDDAPLLEPGEAPGSSQQQAAADATATQTDPANENVAVRVDDAGDTGPVSQSNEAGASADASAKPSKPKDGGSESSSSADAEATAKQEKPKNTNVEVRVDSPGDVGTVTQSNSATATAGAGGGSTGSAADGHEANASATQTSPQNVNVVGRVDSPGDNGGVVQSNAAAAAAGSGLQPPAGGTGSDAASGSFETDQLVTTSGSATVTNDGTLVQEIDQDQGGTTPPEPGAGATAGAPGATSGSATATQADALNASVSIRIDSPGSDGPVRQSSQATRTGPDGKVVTVGGGTDIDVALSLTGSAGERGDLATWVWNWVWDGAWKPPAGLGGANAAPTAGSLWNWLWEDAVPGGSGAPPTAAGAAGSGPPAQPAEAGVWSWTWTWILADGSRWSFEQRTSCECAWVWTWVWDWSEALPALEQTADGAGAEETPATPVPDPAGDGGPVTQLNAVTATATATVELVQVEEAAVIQTGSDPALELQGAWAVQRLVNQQVAIAAAEAEQAGAANVNVTLGFPVESVDQANTVEAEALASDLAEVTQVVVQAQEGDGATVQWAEAEQWAANEQTSIAVALAVQEEATNVNLVTGGPADEARLAPVEQANEAEATAVATSVASITQQIGQAQQAGLALIQSAAATQLHASVQTALAAAVVTQTRTTNLHDARVPAGSRATNPSLRQRNLVFTDTTATNRSVVDAWILQTQAGSADIELSSAAQEGVVEQSAEAYSPASQLDLLNRAGWLGIEPPAPEEGPVVEETPPAVASPTTYAVVTSTPGTVVVRTKTTASTREKTIKGGSDRLDKLGGTLTAGTGEPGAHERKAQTPPLRPPARPWTGLRPGTNDAPPVAVPGHSARPADHDGTPRSKRSKGPSDDDDSCAALLGTSGCAPFAGGGAAALLGPGGEKLAAPAHLGPHDPGPVLGRSVGFLEPFERPG
jgi:hypothetical protein